MLAVLEGQKRDLLDRHNVYRCMHGAPPLQWSNRMYRNIEEHFRDATDLTHSNSYDLTRQQGGPAGENLYWSNNVMASFAVDLWYGEHNRCGRWPGCIEESRGTVGHFTAMVWKRATKMACTKSSNGRILACRYGNGFRSRLTQDTPNMPDGYARNVFPATKSR